MDFGLSEWFWRPSFWLPHGLTWDDLQSHNGLQYPDYRDIWTYPIVCAVIMIVVRSWILNTVILEPIARTMGLTGRALRPPPPNKMLENMFTAHNGCVSSKAIEEASVSLQLTRRQVERWLRNRAAMTKLTKLDKFQDSVYICLYHFLITVYGLSIMISKPWLWNIALCFQDYPHHNIDDDVWWYYIIGSAFYWSQTIWQFKYSHGKDASIAYIHHICTILLMSFSWTCNFVRFGTLILLIHECGDIPLQVVKILRYLKIEKSLEGMYFFFVALWLLTRMGLFPFWILRFVCFEAPKYMFMPSAYVFYTFLAILFVLNLIWTVLILYSVYKRMVLGYVQIVVSSDENGQKDSNAENT